MVTLVKLLKGVLLLALSLGAANQEILVDASYVVLTGYSRCELEELSYLSESELEQRIGLAQVPRGPWTLRPRYCELSRHQTLGSELDHRSGLPQRVCSCAIPAT